MLVARQVCARPLAFARICRRTLGVLSSLAALLACSTPRGASPVPERAARAAASVNLASASAAPIASANASAAATAGATAAMPLPPFAGGTHAVASDRGLVVAVEATAANVGAEVLRRGGNAVDAAVATAFALAVTHPSAASLGGGGFALVRAATGVTAAIDFRETAPRSLGPERFRRLIAERGRGAQAVGVPGFAAGLALLCERFGSRPLAELIAPAQRLASEGVRVGAWQAELMHASFAALEQDAAARRVFAPHGRPLEAGTLWRQPDLVRTLSLLGERGVSDFYRGTIADRLVRALGEELLSHDDLSAYRAIEREPLSIDYRGYTLETMPPPSAGGVALIGTLLASARTSGAPNSTANVHQLLEAERRAQAARRLRVVDPDSLTPEQASARRMQFLDPAYWSAQAIDPEHATPSRKLWSGEEAPLESEHTTHLSVVDRDGLAVSLTTTLSASFGAKVVAAGTGIVLNNALGSFSNDGDNRPRAGQRTTSSMAPTLILARGRTLAVLGTPGGDSIPSTLAQIVRHLIDERLPLDAAIEAPRWHQNFLPDQARYEPTPTPERELLKQLADLGHHLRRLPRRLGDANCIVLVPDSAPVRAFGYADSREPGVAVGP